MSSGLGESSAATVGETMVAEGADEPPIKVLLVEDDAVDRMAFERFVRRQQLGYEVVTASSVDGGQASVKGAEL